MIESHLCGLLDRVFHADGLAPLNRVIRDYVLCGGKRLRPQLCAWTYSNCVSADTDPPTQPHSPTILLDLACAWELFHAFLLAHDDIIDGAEVRRERPSLHRQLAALDGNSGRFGTNLGIVAGDLLFSGAMRVWHELDAQPPVYRQLLRLFSRVACMTGFGQAIDICQSHVPVGEVDERLLLREYHWKTAAYTFEGPMLSGAILAGVDETAHGAISRFALALGQAYQLHNDLLDLGRRQHGGCDLAQGKRTVTLLRARAAMSGPRRAEFDRRLRELQSEPAPAGALVESLRAELRSTDAADQTRRLIDNFTADAELAARDAALPATLARGMSELLGSLRQDYFVA